ncbi:MAG TPA: MBL fold metallo-hydrolase [Terriglobia bacterium]|nr:MBL fold metallo-hydrolase [Terriglobia bacterium]
MPEPHLLSVVGRLLLIAFLCLSPVLCPLFPAFAAGTRYEVREIKPQVYAWIPEDIIEEDGDPDFTRAGTAGFIVTRQGVVVVDTTNTPFHGRELLYEIRQRTEQPVTYVVDTNGTSDQVLGNEVFLDLNATILATPGVQAAMRERQQQLSRLMTGDRKLQRRMRGIHIKLPGRTFQGEMLLRPGGQEIRLMSLDTGGSDLVVYLPVAKVVFLGDLFENHYLPQPEPGPESRNIHQWIDALRTVEAWDAEVYVPGHGEPGAKKDVAAFREFLEWLSNEVQTRIAERKNLEQTKTELVPLVENYHWRAPELAPGVVTAVYQQFVEESSRAPEPVSPPKN